MDLTQNARRFSGKKYVQIYDQFRPSPPLQVIHQCLNYLGSSRANCVVDLGCGTGISTIAWRDFAAQIIGFDPSDEMLHLANAKLREGEAIRFEKRFAHDLPLETESVDVLTCSQSFHWMEPESTLREMDRVLKKKGVLCIYDVQWPPTVNFEMEQAYRTLFDQVEQITAKLENPPARKWRKDWHLENLKKSKRFRFLKEVGYHMSIPFDRERFIGLAMSQGGLEALLKLGFSMEELGINTFREKIQRAPINPFGEMTLNYRVIFGIK